MLEAQLVNPINKFRSFKQLNLYMKFSCRLTEATVNASEGCNKLRILAICLCINLNLNL